MQFDYDALHDLANAFKEIDRLCCESGIKKLVIGNITFELKSDYDSLMFNPLIKDISEMSKLKTARTGFDPFSSAKELSKDLGSNPDYPKPVYDSALFNKYKKEHDEIGTKKEAPTINDILEWPNTKKTE